MTRRLLEHVTTQINREKAPAYLMILALILGIASRAISLLLFDFPINDGRLFYIMVEDLINTRYALPAYTSYNSAHIPFAYPPLSFYLAAILTALTGVSIIDLQRWLPFIFSVLSIPAYYALSLSVLNSKIQSALATLAFAVALPAFDRMLMGGGLTRAPAAFFSLLALWRIQRLYSRASKGDILPAMLFAALTVLSHPVYAWFVLYSAGVFFLFADRKRENLGNSLLVAAGVLLLTSPWWLTIVQAHGLAPLTGASQTRGALTLFTSLAQLLLYDLTREYFLDILGALSLLGLIKSLLDRDFFLPLWLLAIFVFEATTPVTYAILPVAMLFGVGTSLLLDVFKGSNLSNRYARIVLITLALYLSIYSFLSTALQFAKYPVLSKSTREAMQWVTDNTDARSTFLLLTCTQWWDDPISEWFPALTGRTSAATVQGHEWGQLYSEHLRQYNALQECAQSNGPECLSQWERQFRKHYTHIFIPKTWLDETCKSSPLINTLRASTDHAVIYDGQGAIIFERR